MYGILHAQYVMYDILYGIAHGINYVCYGGFDTCVAHVMCVPNISQKLMEAPHINSGVLATNKTNI